MKILSILMLLAAPLAAGEKKLKVVASTPTLQSIAEAVGGDRVEAEAICLPDADPHFVDVKPSYIMRLRKADLVVKVGMELDPWMDALVEQAGNRRILKGAAGHVDASRGIEALEIPAVVDRAQGDVHPYGNPHYWLDPENGKTIARTLCEALSAVDPDGAGTYKGNCAGFEKLLDDKIRSWRDRISCCKGRSLVTYHRSWSYFVKRFDLQVPVELEPKPGIPPSAAHLELTVKTARACSACCIVQEPFHPEKPSRFVAEKLGIPVLILHTEPAPEEGIRDYPAMLDRNVEALRKACSP